MSVSDPSDRVTDRRFRMLSCAARGSAGAIQKRSPMRRNNHATHTTRPSHGDFTLTAYHKNVGTGLEDIDRSWNRPDHGAVNRPDHVVPGQPVRPTEYSHGILHRRRSRRGLPAAHATGSHRAVPAPEPISTQFDLPASVRRLGLQTGAAIGRPERSVRAHRGLTGTSGLR